MDAWRTRPLSGGYPYLFVDGIYLKRSWGGSYENIAAMVAIERLNREVRRRTRAVSTFPNGKSALMLVTARLKCIVENEWGRRRYLDVSLLEEKEGRM